VDNSVIRKVTVSTGIISTVAGGATEGVVGELSGYSGDGGPATSAQLNWPNGVAVDSVGNIYIADSNNFVIRKVTVSTGIISTVAGDGGRGNSGDGGLATSAEFGFPNAVALDSAGNIYIVDGNNPVIRKVTVSTGIINTIAGKWHIWVLRRRRSGDQRGPGLAMGHSC